MLERFSSEGRMMQIKKIVDLPLILILVGAGALALVPSLSIVSNNDLNLMITLFTVASLASSWNILAGYVGHVNLGHVAFFGIGSLVTRRLWLERDVSFELAFIAGGFAAALAAVIVGAPVLRLKGIYFAIGTLASAEALRLTVATVLPRISRLPGPELRGYRYEPRFYLTLGVLFVIVLFVYWLARSRAGLGMMAIREDEAAARSIGINIFLHSMFAFVMSAFFAGLAGSAFAYVHQGYYPSYTFGPEWTFDALLVTFVGGIGTLTGPLAGAVFFVLIRDYLAKEYVNIHLIIFGILFIIVVLLLPGGLVDASSRFSKWLTRQRPA